MDDGEGLRATLAGGDGHRGCVRPRLGHRAGLSCTRPNRHAAMPDPRRRVYTMGGIASAGADAGTARAADVTRTRGHRAEGGRTDRGRAVGHAMRCTDLRKLRGCVSGRKDRSKGRDGQGGRVLELELLLG